LCIRDSILMMFAWWVCDWLTTWAGGSFF
jgi:hypothetical protein